MHGIAPMRTYPQILVDSKPLLKEFTKNAHECAMQVLRTLATQLDLPRETFVELNTFNKPVRNQHSNTIRSKNIVGLTHLIPGRRSLPSNAQIPTFIRRKGSRPAIPHRFW
jgi:hypothetical protein